MYNSVTTNAKNTKICVSTKLELELFFELANPEVANLDAATPHGCQGHTVRDPKKPPFEILWRIWKQCRCAVYRGLSPHF